MPVWAKRFPIEMRCAPELADSASGHGIKLAGAVSSNRLGANTSTTHRVHY
jgi:hypothetical protein